MKEILAGNLDLAIDKLGIKAIKVYDDGEEYQVWELSDEEFEKLEQTEDELWLDDWGWWRYAGGSTMGSVDKRFSINGHWLNAWKGDGWSLIKYDSLIEYINNELNLSSGRNICALTTDLAQQSHLTLGELFNKYQPKTNNQ